MRRPEGGVSSKARTEHPFRRGVNPRLRTFIEQLLRPFESKKEAASRLKTSSPELSLYLQGARTPSPEAILQLLRSDESVTAEDFCNLLDQLLIDGGFSPLFFKYLTTPDHKILKLEKSDSGGYSIHEAEANPRLIPDVRFACRRSGVRVALLERDEEARFFLLEPVDDDTNLNDGDVTLFTCGGSLYFGRLSRINDKARFSPIDPYTMNASDGKDTHWEDVDDLRARVLLQFTSPAKSSITQQEQYHNRPVIRDLDKIRVGVSPFQDSLLIAAGVELGFYEEQGILVQPEAVDWYAWPHFFKDNNPTIVFSNIFTFIREYRELPSLRFLYGVNLFHRGFALLSKEADGFEKQDVVQIGTIAESDWAAQLFSLCQTLGYNLSVKYGPSKQQFIYPRGNPLPNAKTIVIVDATRLLGVVNDPGTIHRTQAFYFGSVPQRFRLVHDFDWSIVESVKIPGPFPVNGFVGTSEMYTKHADLLMRFIRAWFRTINYIQPELSGLLGDGTLPPHSACRLVQRAFESDMFSENTAKLRIARKPFRNEIVDAWQLETFPRTPAEVERTILGTGGSEGPWKKDAQRAIEYLAALFDESEPNTNWMSLKNELDGIARSDNDSMFLLEDVQRQYVKIYGDGRIVRKSYGDEPRPEVLTGFDIS